MIEIIDKFGRSRRGPRRSLTYEEAYEAAELIVSGRASPVQIGAFLMAERIKMETADEIGAFVDVMLMHSYKQKFPVSIDCTGGVYGRTHSFMATFPTAFVLASCGLPVTLHGNLKPRYRKAVTVIDLLQLLGVPIEQPSISNTLIQAGLESGVMIVPIEEWSPAIKRLRPIREEFGLHSILDIAEQYLRPTSAPYMATGVESEAAFERTVQIMKRIGVQRGIIVQGMDGSEDIGVGSRTRTIIFDGGFPELFIVDPEMYGLGGSVPEKEWSPAEQLSASLSVLRNSAEPELRNTVALNAAVRLWMTNMVDSIEDGIRVALVSLEQGAARRKYETWIATASRTFREDVG